MRHSLKDFINLCSQIEDPALLEEFLNLFFTIEEQQTFRSRMIILEALLKKDLSQRDISQTYKVSISQITRGSNAIKRISKDLLNFLERNMLKDQNHIIKKRN